MFKIEDIKSAMESEGIETDTIHDVLSELDPDWKSIEYRVGDCVKTRDGGEGVVARGSSSGVHHIWVPDNHKAMQLKRVIDGYSIVYVWNRAEREWVGSKGFQC